MPFGRGRDRPFWAAPSYRSVTGGTTAYASYPGEREQGTVPKVRVKVVIPDKIEDQVVRTIKGGRIHGQPGGR